MSNIPNLGEFGFIPEQSHETPKNPITNQPKQEEVKKAFLVDETRKTKKAKESTPEKEDSPIMKTAEEQPRKESTEESIHEESIGNEKKENTDKKYKWLPYILSGVILLLIGGIIYYFFFRKKESPVNQEFAQQPNTDSLLSIPLHYNPNKINTNPFLKNQNRNGNFNLRYGIG